MHTGEELAIILSKRDVEIMRHCSGPGLSAAVPPGGVIVRQLDIRGSRVRQSRTGSDRVGKGQTESDSESLRCLEYLEEGMCEFALRLWRGVGWQDVAPFLRFRNMCSAARRHGKSQKVLECLGTWGSESHGPVSTWQDLTNVAIAFFSYLS